MTKKKKQRRTRIWLSPAPCGGWQVLIRHANGETSASYYETKKSAVLDAKNVGRTLASADEWASVYVCGRDGKIQKEWSYGNDPAKYPS